jgi:hypothetical protein
VGREEKSSRDFLQGTGGSNHSKLQFKGIGYGVHEKGFNE